MLSFMNRSDIIRLDLPATHKFLSVLDAFSAVLERADGLAEPATLAYNVQLAVHEICTNIVRHAYNEGSDGRIYLTLTLMYPVHQEYKRLIVELYDTGRSFDPSKIPDPDLAIPGEHGYGLFLVRQLMDEVIYHAKEGQAWRSTGEPWERCDDDYKDAPSPHDGLVGNWWRLIKTI
jgi:serine/threonine-protein kinase RsbW